MPLLLRWQSPLSPLGWYSRQVWARMQFSRNSPSDKHGSAMCLGISSTRKTFKTWIESCKGPPRQWGAGTQDIRGEAEPAEEMLQGELSAVCCYLLGGWGEDLSTLFLRCPVEGWEAAECPLQHGEFWPDGRKKLFTTRWSNTEWCPERFGVFSFGDIKTLTGCSARQPNVAAPTLSSLSDWWPPEVPSKYVHL